MRYQYIKFHVTCRFNLTTISTSCKLHPWYTIFLLAVKSFTELGPQLLKIPNVDYLLSEVFSQDPLERYFSHQRHRGGSNDNPTAEQVPLNAMMLIQQWAVYKELDNECGTGGLQPSRIPTPPETPQKETMISVYMNQLGVNNVMSQLHNIHHSDIMSSQDFWPAVTSLCLIFSFKLHCPSFSICMGTYEHPQADHSL